MLIGVYCLRFQVEHKNPANLSNSTNMHLIPAETCFAHSYETAYLVAQHLYNFTFAVFIDLVCYRSTGSNLFRKHAPTACTYSVDMQRPTHVYTVPHCRDRRKIRDPSQTQSERFLLGYQLVRLPAGPFAEDALLPTPRPSQPSEQINM